MFQNCCRELRNVGDIAWKLAEQEIRVEKFDQIELFRLFGIDN